MQDEERELRNMLNMYPDYFNVNLPHSVVCSQDGDNLELPFKRTCPKTFKIDVVEPEKRAKGCFHSVTYSLKDGDDLPNDSASLKHVVSYLTNFHPLNTIILHEERSLKLPKQVVIRYKIVCQCRDLDFDDAVHSPQVQHLEKKFQILQV